DSAYNALKENPDAHAIVPGDPGRSVVFQRISTTDTTMMMPPPGSNLSLTAYEISMIEKWIRQGAKYEKHWAFVAPRKAPLPEVKDKDWVTNEFDYFILDKLEQQRLRPNGTADRERLLKRVSLDITGLPPSVELMDRFLNDSSDNA